MKDYHKNPSGGPLQRTATTIASRPSQRLGSDEPRPLQGRMAGRLLTARPTAKEAFRQQATSRSFVR